MCIIYSSGLVLSYGGVRTGRVRQWMLQFATCKRGKSCNARCCEGWIILSVFLISCLICGVAVLESKRISADIKQTMKINKSLAKSYSYS